MKIRSFLFLVFLFSFAFQAQAQIRDSLPWFKDFSFLPVQMIKTAKLEGITFNSTPKSGLSSITLDRSKMKVASFKNSSGTLYKVVVPADYSSKNINIQALSARSRGNKLHLSSGNKAALFSCNCNIQVSGNTIRGVGGKLKSGNKGRNKLIVPVYTQ